MPRGHGHGGYGRGYNRGRGGFDFGGFGGPFIGGFAGSLLGSALFPGYGYGGFGGYPQYPQYPYYPICAVWLSSIRILRTVLKNKKHAWQLGYPVAVRVLNLSILVFA